MCGIFGLIQKEDKGSGKIFRDLLLLSESRGKEASGFAILNENKIKILKTPFPASDLVKGKLFSREILHGNYVHGSPFIGIGHSRLVTNGYEHFEHNNQPVVKNGMVVIHNGIIVNQSDLWKQYNQKEKISDLDSELIPTIIGDELNKGLTLGESIGRLFNAIYGMTNTAFLSDSCKNLILATNNGSIYYISDPEIGFFVFASERYILETLLRKHSLSLTSGIIHQLNPGKVISINLTNFDLSLCNTGEQPDNLESILHKHEIENLEDDLIKKEIFINTSMEHNSFEVNNAFADEYLKRKEIIDHLKRCTKCILPETFPFVEFDDQGICNYCRNYQEHRLNGKEELLRVADKYRRSDGRAECLIPFSGGRDSSFVLHYVVKELGLKPIAFSYDWGLLTDLARRNQSRMCGKLGVEHILVSADIRKKRSNIRKNVTAWLKKPSLGTVPLFMAGDKQYFYFANLLMKQNDLPLSVLGENLLETTKFKSGFCGVKPNFGKKHTYSLSVPDKIKMASFYGKQFLLNPAYQNSSLFDTVDAFKSYYLIKHNNLNLFDFIKWDENIISKALLSEYDWETDPGAQTTWRIGDGTAAFYNYIYYMVAGFCENDTFRSNQIREGDLEREKALEFSIGENQPRWHSIQWYCRTIGIDFEETINRINCIPALFSIYD